jgi:hypothetical protein
MGSGGDELDRWRRRSRVTGTRRKMTAMGSDGDELARWRKRSRVAGTRRKMTAIGSGGDELDRCRREERQRHSASASRSSQPLRAQKGGPGMHLVCFARPFSWR